MSTLNVDSLEQVEIQVLIVSQFRNGYIKGIKYNDYFKAQIKRLAEIYTKCRGYTPHNNYKYENAKLRNRAKQLRLNL